MKKADLLNYIADYDRRKGWVRRLRETRSLSMQRLNDFVTALPDDNDDLTEAELNALHKIVDHPRAVEQNTLTGEIFSQIKMIVGINLAILQIRLPRFEMPRFEMPRFEMPRFEMPRFEMPRFEIPQLELREPNSIYNELRNNFWPHEFWATSIHRSVFVTTVFFRHQAESFPGYDAAQYGSDVPRSSDQTSPPNPGLNEEKVKRLNIPLDEIPQEMLCCISQFIMTDPVYFKGLPQYVYERSAIQYALSLDPRDPFTRESRTSAELVSNTNLKNEIETFLEQAEEKVNTQKKYSLKQ